MGDDMGWLSRLQDFDRGEDSALHPILRRRRRVASSVAATHRGFHGDFDQKTVEPDSICMDINGDIMVVETSTTLWFLLWIKPVKPYIETLVIKDTTDGPMVDWKAKLKLTLQLHVMFTERMGWHTWKSQAAGGFNPVLNRGDYPLVN